MSWYLYVDGSPPGTPVPGVLQAGTLRWVPISFSVGGDVCACVRAQSLSRIQLCDPMNYSQPGSFVHGIF